jgi:hypothetical protein
VSSGGLSLPVAPSKKKAPGMHTSFSFDWENRYTPLKCGLDCWSLYGLHHQGVPSITQHGLPGFFSHHTLLIIEVRMKQKSTLSFLMPICLLGMAGDLLLTHHKNDLVYELVFFFFLLYMEIQE